MDMTESIAPKSDQMDYEDLLGGERAFTIQEVRRGPSSEQPVEIVLAEFPRPWRPAKSMRRILVHCWGADGSQYVGKRVLLFSDPTVLWAGKPVGGIRIKALSGIDGPQTVALTVTRGKRAPFKVQPLTEEHSGLTDAQIAECTDLDQLRAMWSSASTVQQEQINARATELAQEVQE